MSTIISNRIQRLFILLSVLFTSPVTASQVEVLHWWTSGGELDALSELQSKVEETDNTWLDFAIKGGGGNTALTVLRSRAVSGNPPTAALIKGHNIQEWAKLGFLTSLDDIAKQEQWDAKLPEFIKPVMKYQGHYVAVPINIHRINWLWFNETIFNKASIAIPRDLAELITVLPQLEAAGYLPIAHTSEPWADAILFESISLSILSAEQYKQAFVELNPQVLASPAMIRAFAKLRTISLFIDANAKNRTWEQSTKLLIEDQAAMQIMGDWVAGKLLQEKQKLNTKIRCIPFPGTEGIFSYNIDSFAFFKLKSVSSEVKKAQNTLASIILTPELQRDFNVKKGSLPIIDTTDKGNFNACTQQAYQDYQQATRDNTLVPTFSQAMATTTYVQSAITRVISNFIYDKSISNQAAVVQLVNAIKAAQ
ncbi:ABC transporter substrate-binding protein [Moritella viscosa]|uniref:Probable sugar-binding periplasmic protein n=1 Tax=Moritella viscosa TaxID=80854 RepID=A0A1K9ZY16_9GAMM|nr:ABC transporter substrate-binding protein [Moritella viscosa]SGZ04352.1 Putative ABC-type sugar transport system, periplasmic component [Moritella viscosa]SHO08073.1 Putative ABC-type sugar transport system, periplasmic component [Moritella viscosa]SHO08127.1 Putative ABC-type sugar transport system, periplasmic component [Moritella viscosa]SHO12405.1 Putative ABC-type sugar transport system, periplasmic component [Moritella viscosa]SHO16246.1 Putative ABC-type sugar transport system, perip